MHKMISSTAPVAKRQATVGKSKRAGQVLKAAMAAQAFVHADGSSRCVMPRLNGADSAELMKAAGILTETGKLKKSYR